MSKPTPAHNPTDHSSGLTLLEVIISIAIVSIAISALVVISNTAISTVRNSRNNAIADQYVRQALEATRVVRDQAGWAAFTAIPNSMAVDSYRAYSLSGTILTLQQELEGSNITADPCTAYMHEEGDDDYLISGTGDFYRSVVLHRLSTDQMEVTANVCYNYTSTHSRRATVQTILTNWQ